MALHTEPAASISVTSAGNLGAEQNKAITAAVFALIKDKLGIDGTRYHTHTHRSGVMSIFNFSCHSRLWDKGVRAAESLLALKFIPSLRQFKFNTLFYGFTDI